MLKIRRTLAMFLCVSLIFSSALSVSAADTTTDTTEVISEETSEEVTKDQTQENVDAPAEESEDTSEDETEGLTYDIGGVSPYSSEAQTKETTTQTEASEWTSDDFTYTSYEKRLYGCDYSRDFVIKGSAIAGFSESGEAKLAKNTDLVLPAVDDEGYVVVGVADRAFYNKGLTSVTFPTGMMVDYDDTVTNGKVTKRGNFVIGESAFAYNNLTSVTLPEGVIACLTSAFEYNQLITVKLPKTIWWLETYSFRCNRITTVNFPTTCDFQLEMHGMPFAKNFIKSVRLPDYTEVVNKDSFMWNTGKEPLADEAASEYKTYAVDGQKYDAGIVYMYTDNAELEVKDRIHHDGKSTSSQFSYFQRLVVNDGTSDTENTDLPWNVNDFIFDGQTVTGLSASGIAKRATNKDLVIPDFNKDGMYVTAIGDAKEAGNGLFASADEGFDSVYLPSGLQTIGNYAFQNNGLKEVTFPSRLASIGECAFQTNNLTSVILPDTVTTLGNGAFSTNPKLARINLSKGLTKIPDAAFGCSDATNYMTNLTSITLHEGLTEIGKNAFAGNNFASIEIPSTVKTIGNFAFSTKNYLTTACTVTLHEGLETIGNYAFRNKVISEIMLPTTVTKIYNKTFLKEYSDNTANVVTKVYVSLKSQYEDTKNFPASDHHKLYLTASEVWTAEDFTYGEESYAIYPAAEGSNSTNNFTAYVVTGLSEQGETKLETNKNLVIPSKDPSGKKVQGVGASAFSGKGIEHLTLPENVMADWKNDAGWTASYNDITQRGDFFIGTSAFAKNNLTTLELPEGVFYVGNNAFQKNTSLTTVKFPSTIIVVGNTAFGGNAISAVEFPETTTFPLQVNMGAFALNKLQAVQLPSTIEKLDTKAFMNNKDGSNQTAVVEVYIDVDTDALGSQVIQTSQYHEVKGKEIPEALSSWNANDFTYDTEGTTITGLSDSGKAKIKSNPALVLPKTGPTDKAITALGAGKNQEGIFVVTETAAAEDGETKYYTPVSVVLPETLKTIGNWAFALNGALTYQAEMTSIHFPEGLESIGNMAFQYSKLTTVSIPDSVTTMGMGAFTTSANLTSVKLSKNVTDIPDGAFLGGDNTKIETLVIPEGVKTIGNKAFNGVRVENLTLPSTLTTIGDYAFQNHQLTKLEISSNVTKIGKYAFKIADKSLTKKITELTLHEGLTSIGKEAFVGSAITEVVLPSTLELSTTLIFGTKIAPASPIVKFITSDKTKAGIVDTEGSYNTTNTNSYSHIVVYNKLAGTGWETDDFTYSGTTLTGWSASGQAKRLTLKTLVLPDMTPSGEAITAIGEAAFKIPDNEVEVTKFGIESPNGMTSVVLPDTLTEIGKEAFSQNALTKMDLTNLASLTTIGESAFYGNQLAEVSIPDNVTSMGDGAFATNDITKLRLSSGVTKIPQGAFSMNIRLEQIEIPNTVTEIGEMAFAGARLTSLTIPTSVTKIERKAFHLHHLKSLVIPGNVKEIGESAFEGTYKATTLETLVIQEGVESIGKYAFKEALLETVHFPESLKTIGEKPFENNKGKDGSYKVEVTTTCKAHRSWTDDTYTINYTGDIDLEEVENDISLEFDQADYTGKAIEPKVTITGLTEGKDFKVTYADNVVAGTAYAIITGAGQYVGTIALPFTIVIPSDAELIVQPNTPSVSISGFDRNSIIYAILTDEELADVENGVLDLDNLQVYLQVENIGEDNVPAADIVSINSIASSIKGFVKGMYLDMSMYKTFGDGIHTKITKTELDEKITITIEIPAELSAPSGKVRTFYIVRVHDGVAELLEAVVKDNKITFETDRFSTYAIGYTETDAEGSQGGSLGGNSNGGSNGGTTAGVNTGSGNGATKLNSTKIKNTAANTGDNSPFAGLTLLLMISVVVIVGNVAYRRKK